MQDAAWEEIVALALAAPSRHAFREAALPRFVEWVGADGGFIQDLTTGHGAPADGCFVELDPWYIERCAAGWARQYGPESVPLFDALTHSEGAVLDVRVYDAKARAARAVYADIHIPQGFRECMMSLVDGDPDAITSVVFTRRAHTLAPLGDDALATARRFLPLLALGDRLLTTRAPRPDAEIPIPRLSPREREIVDLLALGYTNREIGAALGTSAHTVRNQLVGVFEKAGVTTRAELAGLVSRSRP